MLQSLEAPQLQKGFSEGKNWRQRAVGLLNALSFPLQAMRGCLAPF